MDNILDLEIALIENKIMYAYTPNSSYFCRWNTDTFEKEWRACQDGNNRESNSLTYDKILVWDEGNLYYANVYDGNTPEKYDYGSGIAIPDFEEIAILLLSNCAYQGYWGQDLSKLKFKVVSLSGTEYYMVKINAKGDISIIKESEYIAGDQKVITLQPINKQ